MLSIGINAFYRCSNLSSVTLSDGTENICDLAFHSCTSLSSIEIPDSVTSIGYDAFQNTELYNNRSNWENNMIYIGSWLIKCDGLAKDYIVKSGTKHIADYAFENSNPTTLTLPDSLISLGKCSVLSSNITSVTVPKNVERIDDGAFGWCEKLESITVDSANEHFIVNDGVLFSKDMTEIIQYPCNLSRTSYSVPNGVTTVYKAAFSSCKNLTEIIIPQSVTNIDDFTFDMCISLKNIVIPEGVTRIGYNSFYHCEALECISLPSSLKMIDAEAFYCCNSLETITIPQGIESVEDRAFSACEMLESVVIPNSVKKIGDSAFSECKSLNNITVPESVTSIGKYAFAYSALKSIEIPNSVTKIGEYAFKSCKALESITLSESLSSISSHTFEECTSLKSITIPDNVSSILSYAFKNSGLESVFLGTNVASIQSYAFTATPLSKVYYAGGENDWEEILIDYSSSPLKDAEKHFYFGKPYTITWINGDEKVVVHYAGGDKIVAPTFLREGYKFIGWNLSVPDVMPEENLSFSAIFRSLNVNIKINSKPLALNYGDGVILSASTNNMPEDAEIRWYIDGMESGSGNSFVFENAVKNVEISVKIVDASGNALDNEQGKEVADSVDVKVNAGFFQRLISFFKNLFKVNRIVPQSYVSER